MRPKILYKLIVLLMLSIVLVFAQNWVIAGDFLSPKNLSKEQKKYIKEHNSLELSDSLLVDLDMDAKLDLVLSEPGLILIFDKGDTLELSEGKGQILACDCNNDSIPDLVQKIGNDWFFYENLTLPQLQSQTISMQEDSTLLILLPQHSPQGDIDYKLEIDTSHITLDYSEEGVWVIPDENWHGTENLKINYSRGRLSNSVDYSINVMPVNDLPYLISQREELVLLEDQIGLLPIDSLLSCMYDADGKKDLKLKLLGGKRNCRRIGNNYVYKPKENWSGRDTLYFWIADKEAGDTLVQYVTVQAVNDAPKWKAITTIRFPEDEFRQFPLSLFSDYASDAETPDSLLRYYVFSGEHVSISAEGGKITLIADENWYGKDKVLLKVSDGELTDSTYWYIEVMSVNDAPVLSELPDTVFYEDEGLIVSRLEFEQYAYDVENSSDALKWQIRRLGKVRAYYNGSNVRCSSPQDWFGSDSLEVTVSDGELRDSQIWHIHVLPVNDSPHWDRSQNQRSFLEDEDFAIKKSDLYAMVKDPETAAKDLLWKIMPSSHIHVNEFKDKYILKSDKNWFGNTSIRFVVDDGEYADTMTYKLKVLSVNDKPHISDIPEHSWKEDDTLSISKSYLHEYVSDVETPRVDLIWSFYSNNSHVRVKDKPNSITLSSAPDWNGSAKIGLIVYDGGLRDTGFMKITVNAVNDAPRWKAFPDTSIAEDGFLALPFDYIKKFVSDPDKGDDIKLEYSAGDKFYIEEKENMIVLWPEDDWFGKEKLEITADDGRKKVKTTWNIPVFAVNDAPYFTMALPDSLTFYTNGSDTLLLDEIVYDIDNKSSELEWDITDGSITHHTYDEKLNAYIFYTENFTSGEDLISVRVTDGFDVITCFIPVLVKEVDRFLMANPVKLELLPNTPNPFRDFTDIRFSLPVGGYVTVKIYDLLGQEIITLTQGYHDAQNYSIRWFGETDSGMTAPSGVYLCRMSAVIDGEPAVLMRKMMLVR